MTTRRDERAFSERHQHRARHGGQILFGALIAVLAVLLPALMTPATHNPARGQITLTAAQRAEAAQLDTIVVSYAGPAINRKGCGASVGGTFVIGWNPDRDACEDAEIVSVPYMCGSGKVTYTCPSLGSAALNKRYYNRPIVVVLFYNTFSGSSAVCLATAPDRAAVLGRCPSTSGSGGSNGTIYVWSSYGYLISRYWSSAYHNGNPFWLCNDSGGYGHVLDTGSGYDYGSSCRWDNAGIPGT